MKNTGQRGSKIGGNLSFCLTKKNNQRNPEKSSRDIPSKVTRFDFDMMKQTFSKAPSRRKVVGCSNRNLELGVEGSENRGSSEGKAEKLNTPKVEDFAQKVKRFEF